MFDIEKIAKEHEVLFPNADLESQMKKLEEEVREVKKASSIEEAKKEFADCLIVFAGIYRFDKNKGNILLLILRLTFGGIFSEIEKLANKKWEINKKRKWEFKNGVYHHIED